MDTQSFQERQEDEVECLQFVFMNDFEDIRSKDSWKVPAHSLSRSRSVVKEMERSFSFSFRRFKDRRKLCFV